MLNSSLCLFHLYPSSACRPSKDFPFHHTANTWHLLIFICFSQNLNWNLLFFFIFSVHRHFSPFYTQGILNVSTAPDDFLRTFSLRKMPTALSNFKILVPQELLTAIMRPSQVYGRLDNRTSALVSSSKLISTDTNWLVSVLNSLRCSVMLSLSAIFRLNNFFINKPCLILRVCCTSSIGLPLSLGSSSPWRYWTQPSMLGITGSFLGLLI